jgi:anti-sigma factor RsiW
MENNFLLTDDLLWDYADGFLDATEKAHVEAYLRQHPEWRARLEMVQTERRALLALPVEKPKAGFADGVMAAWVAERAGARTHSAAIGRDWVMYAIAGVFGLFLLFPLVALVLSASSVSIPDTYALELPAADWAGLLGSAFVRYALLLALGFASLRLLEKYLQVHFATRLAAR